MTIEELRDQDVLLPEDEWGTHSRSTTVHQLPLAVVLALTVASIVVALIGDGGALTWLGTAGFIVCLFVLTWMFDRAVLRQRRRVRQERRAARR